MRARTLLLGFVAGFVAVLVFHQGMALLLYLAGVLPGAPYSLAARPPLGVPAVLSASFWGGLWGIALALLLEAKPDWPAIPVGVVFGALALTFVALTIVPLFRGQPIAVLDPNRWWRGGLLNGAWGLGVALILVLAQRRSTAPES